MGVLGCYAKAIDVLQILIDSAVKELMKSPLLNAERLQWACNLV